MLVIHTGYKSIVRREICSYNRYCSYNLYVRYVYCIYNLGFVEFDATIHTQYLEEHNLFSYFNAVYLYDLLYVLIFNFYTNFIARIVVCKYIHFRSILNTYFNSYSSAKFHNTYLKNQDCSISK